MTIQWEEEVGEEWGETNLEPDFAGGNWTGTGVIKKKKGKGRGAEIGSKRSKGTSHPMGKSKTRREMIIILKRWGMATYEVMAMYNTSSLGKG